jgi:hypothetical protein
MLSDSVFRAAVDIDVEVRAAYLATVTVQPAARIQVFVVPTVAREYQTYCQIGVSHASNGAPDLTTGHAGAGMHDLITVVP